jgi:predicted nucleotidyltransferase
LEANRLTGLRKRVAREAAFLLYTSQEKEYKQAKKRAAKTLGVRVLPSNLEVAEELDKIAEEREGPSRRERLFQMRKEALQIMEPLKDFNPMLVGSVWRGTAHQNSDIDILAFSQDPEIVLVKLQKNEYRITGSEWRSVTKRGKKEASFHIYLVLPSGYEAEVVVRYPEKMGRAERCEIYGDTVTGLSPPQLQKVLREKPLQKFVPT